MFNIIERYINNMSKEDVNNFAIKKNINLNENELDFTYKFIKKNWDKILSNPNLLNLERYKSNYSLENYKRIKELFNEYYSKYRRFL